jgi:hypothetical protein
MWLNPETREFYPDHATIRAAWPQTSFPAHLTDAGLAELGLERVQPEPRPDYDPATQLVVEGVPALVAGLWTQQWVLRPLTVEEITARRASLTCTPREARLVLRRAGLLSAVEAWIATADEETQIEWEFATDIRRDWPALLACGAALGLTEEQLDGLFAVAATL